MPRKLTVSLLALAVAGALGLGIWALQSTVSPPDATPVAPSRAGGVLLAHPTPV